MNSIWFQTLDSEERAGLEGVAELPRTAEVVIVGAGIVGLACAFYLCERGLRDVAIIERDTIAARASGANAGGLWPNQQGKHPGLWKTLADAGLELLAQLAGRDDFRFDFRRNGILSLIREPAELEPTRDKVARMQTQGFRFEFVSAERVREMEPLLAGAVAGGVFCPSDAHCHPVRLALGYARGAARQGARIVTRTTVTGLQANGTSGLLLKTSRGDIAARRIICANGAWLSELTGQLGFTIPVIPARGQMLATEPLPPLLKTSVIGSYMFTQLVSGHVISGGTVEFAGFDDRPTPETIGTVWRELRRALPALDGAKIGTTWSGLRPHTPDELPIIGPLPGLENVLVAGGHFKNGVLFSALTGRLVSEWLVEGKTSLDLNGLQVERFLARS